MIAGESRTWGLISPPYLQLNVEVYLGALCPDSIRFIQDQVYPLFPLVRDYVDFRFIPFGKAYSVNI